LAFDAPKQYTICGQLMSKPWLT